MFNKKIFLLLIAVFILSIITSTLGFLFVSENTEILGIKSSGSNNVKLVHHYDVANIASDDNDNSDEKNSSDEKFNLTDSDFNVIFTSEVCNNVSGIVELPENATGIIDLYVDDMNQGSYPLNSGTTAWSIDNISGGLHEFKFVYSGDTYYNNYTLCCNEYINETINETIPPTTFDI